jgi:hypothetical protein
MAGVPGEQVLTLKSCADADFFVDFFYLEK